MLARVMKLLPSVAPNTSKPSAAWILIYSVIALSLYFSLASLPLYGAKAVPRGSSNPFATLRHLVAASPGTLAELGVLPFLTARLLIQLLRGLRIIAAPKNANEQQVRAHRERVSGLVKALTYVIALLQAITIVLSGMYGEVTVATSILLIFQITGGAAVIQLLDEVASKAHGLDIDVNIIVAASVAHGVLSSFSFYPTALLSFVLTLALLAAISFAYGFATLALSTEYKNLSQEVIAKNKLPPPADFTMKLLYTGAMPIYIVGAALANVMLLSQALARLFPANAVVGLLGSWSAVTAATPISHVSGGLAYYLSPPESFLALAVDPLRAIYYAVVVVFACTLASEAWFEVSDAKSSAPAIEKAKLDDAAPAPLKLKRSISIDVVLNSAKVKNENDDQKEMHRKFLLSVEVSGLVVGVLAVLGDFLGVAGSGLGLVAATIIINGDLLPLIQSVIKRDEEAQRALQAVFNRQA